MIKEIPAEKTYDIRLKILRKGIDLPYKFDGDFDSNTFHLGAFEDDKLVGIATFMKRKNQLISSKSQYQLRGMATLFGAREKGFGKKLMIQANIILKNKKTDILWCNARKVAVSFYTKNGFKILGEYFNIPTIGKHVVMYKKISNK